VKRAAPIAAWGVLIVTLLIAIGWGAHAPHAWDVDNIAPGSVLRAMAARFGPGWYSSYGPVPYLMVGILYAPLLLAFRLIGELGIPVADYPWGFRHPEGSVGTLILAARLLTVALALAVAWLAVRERWSDAPRARWLVPLLLAGSPAFAFYSRTTNVDLHYLFFLALAFHCAGRDGGWRTRALAGAAAALAVCCKEQSAPLAAVAAAAAGWSALSAPVPRAQRLRNLAAVAIGALAAYALAWGLPFNTSGWLAHHRFLFEQARYAREFAASPAGYAQLALRTGALLPLALGWPILAGALLAVARPAAWRGLGARVLGQLLYAAGFLAVVGYVYPRFLLPVLLLALPLAVRGWSGVMEGGSARRRGAVTALLVLVAIGGPLLGIAQVRDTRYRAAEWLAHHRTEARATAPLRVELVGNPRFQARVPAGYSAAAIAIDTLARVTAGPTADVVMLSSFDRYRVENDPALRSAWLGVLEDPHGPYRPAADLPPPRWSRVVRGLPFSPVIWIWTRRPNPS